MADGTFPGIVSANRDLNTASNVIHVSLSDGSSSLSVTGGILDVTIANSSLAVTQSGTWNIDSIINPVNIQTASGTSITVDGSVSINGSVTVTATDFDIRDLSASQDNVAISDGSDTLAINTDGSINVNVVQAPLSDEIHDFDQASAVVGFGTSNHDYTVVNTSAIITGVYVGASGDAKFEIQKNNGAGFSTVAVAFTTGKQGDSKLVEFPTPLEATTSMRVIRTNRENQAQDLYSTIMGRDVS